MAYLPSSTCLILFALAATIGTVLSDCALLDKYFYIRNKVSGEVLDTSDTKGVRLLGFEDSILQRFELHPASTPGLFNIYAFWSLGSADVLTYKPVTAFTKSNLTLQMAVGSIYQQWFFNADGAIMNAGFPNHGLTVEGDYVVVADATNFGPEDTFHFTDEKLYP